MTTGLPNEEITVVGFCSNTRSLVGGEKKVVVGVWLIFLFKPEIGKDAFILKSLFYFILNEALYLVPLANRG